MLRMVLRNTIWYRDAIPPGERKYAAPLKRVVFPVYDMAVILLGLFGLLVGFQATDAALPAPGPTVLYTVMLLAGVLCLVGCAFPVLWAVEIAGKTIGRHDPRSHRADHHAHHPRHDDDPSAEAMDSRGGDRRPARQCDDLMEWIIGLGAILGGGGLGAALTYLASRKRDAQAALAERFDDASQLAQYVREEVERQVAPIRAELEQVRQESDETRNAFRAWIIGVWRWNQAGRAGDLPMPPPDVLVRLDLHHLANDWPTEPSSRQ